MSIVTAYTQGWHRPGIVNKEYRKKEYVYIFQGSKQIQVRVTGCLHSW